MRVSSSFLPTVAAALQRVEAFLIDVVGRQRRRSLVVDLIDDRFEIRIEGQTVASVPVDTIRLSAWDERRLLELERRILARMSIYDTLESATSWIGLDQRPQLMAQLAARRTALTRDCRDVLRLVDRALRARVSDHFPLRARERTSQQEEERLAV